jgi:tol-pal system protein YbgF
MTTAFPTRACGAALLGLSLTLGCVGSARADLFADNDARRAILDLRDQVTQLQQQQQAMRDADTKQAQQMRGAMLDLNNQIDQLKAEIAQLRGEQDTTTRQLADTVAKVQAGQQDLSQRLAPLEPVTVQIGDKSYSVRPAEKAAFDQPMASFRGSDFAAAGSGFKAFLAQYPASPYAAEAQYWLANALFAQQRYPEAQTAFASLIASSPNSQHLPEAMLGLANTQSELKQLHAARGTLKKLIETYPKSDAAQTAKERLAKLH